MDEVQEALIGKSINISKQLTDFAAGDICEGLSNVGIGIASVFLLIILFYYIVSLLDGGKFQIKMLIPLLFFLIISNFSWISKPVTYFTYTITSYLTENLKQAENDTKSAMAEQVGITDDEVSGYHMTDMYRVHYSQTHDQGESKSLDTALDGADTGRGKKTAEANNTEPAGPAVTADGKPATPAPASVPQKEKTEKERGLVTKAVKRGLTSAARTGMVNTMDEFNNSDGNEYATTKDSEVTTFISSILSWGCSLFGIVVSLFGAVMSAIIVAFGPVTFAFAMVPGNAGYVKSWFLRLCQFSLYSPLAALIGLFSWKIFSFIDSSVESIVMVTAMSVVNMAALTSVPTIASMVIEGASGAASLSSGLQTMGHTVNTLKGMASLGGKALFGAKGRGLGSKMFGAMNNARNQGLFGLAKQGLDKLRGGNGGTSSGGGFGGSLS